MRSKNTRGSVKVVIHDLICNRCSLVIHNQTVDPERFDDPRRPYRCDCHGILEPYYADWSKGLDPNTHPSERVTIYRSLREGGAIQYPGRGDVPVPERLRQRGYEKVELNVRDLARFEKDNHVVNERRHFDKGSM